MKSIKVRATASSRLTSGADRHRSACGERRYDFIYGCYDAERSTYPDDPWSCQRRHGRIRSCDEDKCPGEVEACPFRFPPCRMPEASGTMRSSPRRRPAHESMHCLSSPSLCHGTRSKDGATDRDIRWHSETLVAPRASGRWISMSADAERLWKVKVRYDRSCRVMRQQDLRIGIFAKPKEPRREAGSGRCRFYDESDKW